VLNERGVDITVLPPDQIEAVDDYDAVVLGSGGWTYAGFAPPAAFMLHKLFRQMAGIPLLGKRKGPRVVRLRH
jgi:hypothetical protein